MSEDKKTEPQATAQMPIQKNPATPEVRLPDISELMVSSSPHLHEGSGVGNIMLMVLIALLPACAVGVYTFGLDALRVLILCTVSCVLCEMIWCRIAGARQTWRDGSAAVTGLLLGMNLSAGVPWWICAIGAILAIGLGKQVFGGLGYNPFNPALVARVGLLIGFPRIMTTWVAPRHFAYMLGDAGFLNKAQAASLNGLGREVLPMLNMPDAVTCATPLGIATTGGPFTEITSQAAMMNYFIGNVGGCIGETSAAALLVGGLLLMAFKIIRWHIPVAFIATTALFTYLISSFYPSVTPGPLFHIITGGLLLGAIFMATDMVTSPVTTMGCLIFGAGCGLITACIRIWGSYPEGVSFSILIMNALTPLIDRYAASKPFGFRKPEKAAENK